MKSALMEAQPHAPLQPAKYGAGPKGGNGEAAIMAPDKDARGGFYLETFFEEEKALRRAVDVLAAQGVLRIRDIQAANFAELLKALYGADVGNKHIRRFFRALADSGILPGDVGTAALLIERAEALDL